MDLFVALLVGSVAPVTLRLIVTRAPGSTVDFGDITAASISARVPKATAASDEAWTYKTWIPGSIEHVSESQVRLIYPFQVDDLPRSGDYRLAVDLTVPSGTVPCDPCSCPVGDRY